MIIIIDESNFLVILSNFHNLHNANFPEGKRKILIIVSFGPFISKNDVMRNKNDFEWKSLKIYLLMIENQAMVDLNLGS